jgi:uncharacterized membrane protein
MNTVPGDLRAYRLGSIDLLRGLAIVVMALDHVRDYFLIGTTNDPMTDPDVAPALFLTRWITHFCAPVFVLLAGTSAGLMAARKSPAELGRFLLTRGLWLIAIEIVVISTGWTFAPHGIAQLDGLVLVTMQVIWAIGASMVVLAGLQFLGRGACLALGVAIVVGHNLLDGLWPASTMFQTGPLWIALHAQMTANAGPFTFVFVYPLLPWIGVMLLGFGTAAVFERPAARRDALLLRAGLAMTAAFVVLRALDVYGDPNPWQPQPGGTVATLIDFLNVTKYPPSLAFLLMTLGPAAILCAYADRFRGRLAEALVMFGRVPFAFYVAHLYLIHAIAALLGIAQGFGAAPFFNLFLWFPAGYGLPLWGVYVVWAIVIALLYPFCRWVAGVKARRRDWWLSYL